MPNFIKMGYAAKLGSSSSGCDIFKRIADAGVESTSDIISIPARGTKKYVSPRAKQIKYIFYASYNSYTTGVTYSTGEACVVDVSSQQGMRIGIYSQSVSFSNDCGMIVFNASEQANGDVTLTSSGSTVRRVTICVWY